MLLTTIVSVALAQHVTTDVDSALTAAELPYEATSVGHPALRYTEGVFAMFFEAAVDEPGCDEAFVVGHATSPDGADWTVEARSFGPGPAAPCGYRAPVVAETDDGTYLLMQAVHDDSFVMKRKSGRQIRTRYPTGLEGLESVSIARRDGVWKGLAVDPDEGVIMLESPGGIQWSRSTSILTYGAPWWTLDAIHRPSLSCADGTDWPWKLHYGGDNGLYTGFTYGSAETLDFWFFAIDAQVWDTSVEEPWTRWDSVMDPGSAWTAYEVGSPSRIGWATTAGGLPVEPASRDCHSTP